MKTILSINSTYSTTYGINHTDNALWKYKVYYLAALLYKPVTSSYWILPFCTSLTYFKKPVVCYLLFWLYYPCSRTIHACCNNFTLVEELDGYSLIEAHVLCLYFRITAEYFTVTIIYPVVPNIFNFGPNYHCAQLFEEIWLLLEDLGQYLAELLCSTDIDLCSGSSVQYRTV